MEGDGRRGGQPHQAAIATADRIGGPLAALADALGVATSYEDYLRRPTAVAPTAVRRALAAMGVAADTDEAAARSLAAVRRERAARLLPPTLVVRHSKEQALPLQRPVTLLLEDGAALEVAPRDGRVHLPRDMPLGYHRLELDGDGTGCDLVAAPDVCPLPLDQRGYGWMAQLYAVRSEASWGIGDCGDLAALATWSGSVGADMILINPLHAAAPVLPQEASPYSPTSRSYRNLLYLRIEEVPEYGLLNADEQQRVAALGATARAAGPHRIDRDAAFRAKIEALEILYGAGEPSRGSRGDAYERWRAQQGRPLHDFARFCALAERHGTPWQQWPAALRDPRGGVEMPRDLQLRYELHCWVQWLLDEQLETAQRAARDAGMAVGIVHDLAVGVDPGGADAWANQDLIAPGMTIGAPPDGFNQRGQDWGLPPLVPERLRQAGYAPFRDMLRSVLRHAGGIRIDHVLGLWRLWWVPQDGSAAEGTYVRYPARDLLGVLALEAQRAGAIVIGEDLGTVEAGVRENLAERGVLSSRVVYFEHVDDDADAPLLPAADYPELALTSITTHDLPTPAGWWTDAEIALQTTLGLFGDATTPQTEAQRKQRERAQMEHLLRSEGLISDAPSLDELVVAMHAFLARTPSLLVAAGLGDALGDRRQPNLPGTTTQYPNWRLPLARHGEDGDQPVLLADVVADPLVQQVVAVLRRRAT